MASKKTPVTLVAAFLFFANTVFAQDYPNNQTAFPFLLENVDARTVGMGEARLAVTDDVNAIFNNGSKYIFNSDSIGGAISYKNKSQNDWYADINYDYFNAAGYFHFNEKNAVSAGFRYIDVYELDTPYSFDNTIFEAAEYSGSLNYSRKLSQNFSAGLGLKYIYSNVPQKLRVTGRYTKQAQSVAADISSFYSRDIKTWNKNSNISFGLNISNIGNKVVYISPLTKSFIATNLGLGGAYKIFLNPDHRLTVACDLNKLLVPTPDTTDIENNGIYDFYEQSVFEAMIHSFSDAPDGFEEEIHEINVSSGFEYSFRDEIFFRGGYFYEHYSKGRRQYLTAGAGITYWKFQFDAAYIIPTKGYLNPTIPAWTFTLSATI